MVAERGGCHAGPSTGKRGEDQTPITQKTADFPSAGTVATLARPSFPIEGFCGISEIRGHLRQVFFLVPVEG